MAGDDRRAPADFLDQARDVVRGRTPGPKPSPGIGRDTAAYRALLGDWALTDGSSSPNAYAFQFAGLAAAVRRGGGLCRHAEEIVARGADPTDSGDFLQIIVATGQTLCTPCSDDLNLPEAADHRGRCDVCEAPTATGRDVTCVLRELVVHARVCRACAAFYDEAHFGGPGRRARWEDVLDVQIRLLDLARRDALPFMTNEGEHRDLPPGWQSEVSSALLRAEPVFVTADVQAAWEFAHEAFEPEPIRRDDPFTPAGLALFPSPVELIRAGTEHPADAVLWFPRPRQGTVLVLQFAETTPRRWVIGGMFMVPFERTPEAVLQEAAATMPNWKGESPDEDRKLLRQWAMLQAFWRMAQQFVRAPERAPRPQRRAAQRANLEQQHVTVIRLRRQRHEMPESEQHVDWSCRWMVRGHWRHLRDGRQTYVQPYVKGPDDKPFRVTERVWEFIR